MNVDELAARLAKPKRTRRGGLVALCPAHDDESRSLSVDAGRDGRVLVRCFAGCTAPEIAAALGMAMRDLMGPDDTVTAELPPPARLGRTEYQIRDADGTVRAIHVRVPSGNGHKAFLWKRPDGTDGLDGLATEDLPLYGAHRLREWSADAVLVLAEGEKAADALTRAGIPALGTVTGAAGTPSPAVLASLTGRAVLLWADNDGAGREHMARIAAVLDTIAAPGVVTWPDAPPKGDAADFMATHTTEDAEALLAAAHAWDPDEPAIPAPPPAGDMIGLELADFLAAGDGRVHWHVDGAIVRGALCQWLGPWESFKTMGLLQLGGCIASGVPWLGMKTEPAPFLYVSNEKSPETIRDRLRRIVSAQALRDRVVIVHRAGVRFDRRWDEVIRRAEDMAGAFVGLDTLASLSPAGFNENRSEHMSVALDAIRELTTRGATVALGHHPAKAGGGVGRGHGSLDGEVDGTVEFDRPEKDRPNVTLAIRPKDGEHRKVRLVWNAETFLLELDAMGPPATVGEVRAVVRALYRETGAPVPTARIASEFPNHAERTIRERLAEARKARVVVQVGGGSATAYRPSEDSDGD